MIVTTNCNANSVTSKAKEVRAREEYNSDAVPSADWDAGQRIESTIVAAVYGSLNQEGVDDRG